MTHSAFYGGFPVHKNKFIAATLLDQLGMGPDSTVFKKLVGVQPEHELVDYQNALRLQIRYLCLLTIETLFEIIQALEPEQTDSSLLYTEKQIVDRLLDSTPKKIIPFIARFEDPQYSSEWLDTILENTYSKGKHLFFFNRENKFTYPNDLNMELGMTNIKSAITILAKEVANRAEINSYKHGERIFPWITKIVIQPEGSEEVLTLNGDMAFTFFSQKKESTEPAIDMTIKTTEPINDYKKIVATSDLLQNIISTRRCYFENKTVTQNIHSFSKPLF